MNEKNNFGRLLALLLLTLAMCLGLYRLPDSLFGYRVKRVDLLSDIRVKPEPASLDSLRRQLQQDSAFQVDSAALRASAIQLTGIDSAALAVRDSLYRAMAAFQGADSAGTRIEDYSVGHTGLQRFFAALNGRDRMDRPVRVAFLGDSFIEGDIMVADFRSGMQKRFGGRGVGFVPVSSVAAQFRPTVELRSGGWTTWSMLTDQSRSYVLSGLLFEPEGEEAWLSVKTTGRYPELREVSLLKLYYERNEAAEMQLICNGGSDTVREVLPPVEEVSQYVTEGVFREAEFRFTRASGFRALGLALEDARGVVVDNFSLRGNSGLILKRLDVPRCRRWNELRPYDLIVLQYGLNVVSDSMMQYGWYTSQMVKVIRHLQDCFPQADILMLGVSDRSRQENGAFETMPAVLALLHAQRKAAKLAGVPFWNVFGAMGGENSMVRFVEKNWASKDYTHLSFRGGREIATALLKAFMAEKEFYDKADEHTDE